MRLNAPVAAVFTVIGVAFLATAFRVSTAPDRIRQRAETAKASCARAGGQWVLQGSREVCRYGDARD